MGLVFVHQLVQALHDLTLVDFFLDLLQALELEG